jgi:hypothetical protein
MVTAGNQRNPGIASTQAIEVQDVINGIQQVGSKLRLGV